MLESLNLPANFALTNQGIYFFSGTAPKAPLSLQFLSFATGRAKEIVPIEKPLWFGLTVSPDERSVLYSQTDQQVVDLMLVENFR